MMSQKDVGALWESSILEATDLWLLLANHEARDVASSIYICPYSKEAKKKPIKYSFSSKSQQKGRGYEFLARS